MGAAIKFYTGLGYMVSLPLIDASAYDFIVDTGEKLLKIQVKYTSQVTKEGSFKVDLRGYKDKLDLDFDLLFVTTSSGTDYEFPRKGLKARVTLNEKCNKYIVS